jgi:hypothetical protein
MRAFLCLLCFLVAGCGGGGGGSASSAPPPPPPPPAPVSAEITLLFMGNSHTTFNDLPGMVTAMVRAARPGKSVAHVEAPGWMFLEERASDPAALQLLRARSWSYVVLQAQKYSTSGQFSYSTEGAEALVRISRTANAVPVLFPEWPRLGIPETQRIYDLHVSIARKEPACVAPIGQAWDLAMARNPTLTLHDPDGNHSAPAGAFLAALVIAATITGTSPDELTFIDGFGVDADVQARLRGAAAETVLVYRPRQWCPFDLAGNP